MASNSSISISFELKDGKNVLKTLTVDAKDLQKFLNATVSEADKLNKKFINFAAVATGIDAISKSIKSVQGIICELSDAYSAQIVVEKKLETTMRNSMDARAEDIQSIKDLCSAQQELGVIGDEVQLAGAQEMATYLGKKESLEKLIPVMNDMLAQQYGLNATQESAASIATMLGKVMNGQVGALSRYGYTFDEAQEKILKFGTESERAAVLCDVVSASVGGMNAELAKTDIGKQKQLENTIGDIKERLGGIAQQVSPFISIAAQSTEAVTAVVTLCGGIGTFVSVMRKCAEAMASSTIEFIKNKGAALAVAAAQKIVSAATATWVGVQKVLNLVLTANPIGLIIVAIGALVTAIIAAYNNCESFRQIVDKVWAGIKPLATAIMKGLAKAFEWLVEKCQEAWEWLKNILGLGGKEVEVQVNVTKKNNAPSLDYDEVASKYMDKDKKDPKPKQIAPAKQVTAPEGSLKYLDEKLSKLKVTYELAIDDRSRQQLMAEIKKLESEKHVIEMRIEGVFNRPTYDTEKAVKNSKFNVDGKIDKPQDLKLEKIETSGDDPLTQKAEQLKKINEQLQIGQTLTGAFASAFSGLGQVIGGTTGALVSFAGQAMTAISDIIPQILALIGVKESEAIASGTASGAALPFPANIAAIASIIATVSGVFASLPKFANGGIISGPTVGLMGEYAGASNNPEVVAPLDKLRGMLQPTNDFSGGVVKFKIDGRTLVGVLEKENKVKQRS